MTLADLEFQREQISYLMVEAQGSELAILQQELVWIEEMINELEGTDGEEKI